MKITKGHLFKALGLAGVAGVAATGVVIARDQRQRSKLEPDEIRDRLRARAAEAAGSEGSDGEG